MEQYVSLLRGVNAPGQPKIRMPALRALLQQFGYENVQTYLRSGNAVFSSEAVNADHARVIEVGLKMEVGHEVPVVVIPATLYTNFINSNPLLAEKDVDEDCVQVTFVSGRVIEPIPDESFPAARNEKVIFHLGHYCVYSPTGCESTRLNNDFFERALKMPTTTRDWKTALALAKLL